MKHLNLLKIFMVLCLLSVMSTAGAQKYIITDADTGEYYPFYEVHDSIQGNGVLVYKYVPIPYKGVPVTLQIVNEGLAYTEKEMNISPEVKEIEYMKPGKPNIIMIMETPGQYVLKCRENVNLHHRLVFLLEKEEVLPTSDVVNIDSYGLDNTGKVNETKRLQKALDDVAGTGKTLLITKGTYRVNAIRINSNTKIHLAQGARILADANSHEPYLGKGETTTNRFVYMMNAENIEISGLGILDGNGTHLRTEVDARGDNNEFNARLLYIMGCKNVKVNGIILKDASRWNTHIVGSQDVTMTNCKLMNNAKHLNGQLLNLDGIDIDACQRVTIDSCFIWAGDDAIAIKGVAEEGRFKQDVSDILVKNCILATKKSALKIGTETYCNNIRNVRFENCDILESDRALAIDIQDGALVSGVTFKDIRVENRYFGGSEKRCFFFNLSKRTPESKLGKMENIRIENVTFSRGYEVSSLFRINPEYFVTSDDMKITIKNLKIANTPITSMSTIYQYDANYHHSSLPASYTDVPFGDETNNGNIIFE